MDDFELLLHEARDDVLVLAVAGDVDMATARRVKDAAEAAAARGIYRCLVFDLSRVGFMDSSGLHALVEANRRMKAAGGETRIVTRSRNTARVLELTGLDRVLTIVRDCDSAVASVA